MYISLYGCNMIIYISVNVESSLVDIGYSLKEYDSSSYMNVLYQAQGYRNKKRWKSLFQQCKALIGNNSSSVENRAVVLRAAWGFRLWRIEWCDRHFVTWLEVTTLNWIHIFVTGLPQIRMQNCYCYCYVANMTRTDSAVVVCCV